jgi:hypothetical protein
VPHLRFKFIAHHAQDNMVCIVNRHLANPVFMTGDPLMIANFSLCRYLFYPFYPIKENGYDIMHYTPHRRLARTPVATTPAYLFPNKAKTLTMPNKQNLY